MNGDGELEREMKGLYAVVVLARSLLPSVGGVDGELEPDDDAEPIAISFAPSACGSFGFSAAGAEVTEPLRVV